MSDIILTLDRFGDQALLLGRIGENRATRVLINLKSILSQYPDAIASITVKPPGRAEYPAAVKQEDGILTWEITRADIGNKTGSGQAQITIQDADGTIIKTAIACTRVSESLGNATAPAPNPVETWIDKATGTLADVERAGNAAQAVADEVQRRLDDGDFVGPQGPQGTKGEKGDKGEPGRDGAKGDKGDPGAPGARGEKGEKGDPGRDGSPGATGATPRFTVTVVTGEAGTAASVTQSGTAENPMVEFTIPQGMKGDTGAQGEKGDKGDPGKDAPQEAVLYTAQTLNDAQKTQARENIGAADEARQNILVGGETGNPIAVDDAFSAPLCGLTVYGRSTQDSTPSPDNPVPIVSAGDSGSVTVKVTGKNLLYLYDIEERTVYGVTYSVKNGVIKIKGTSTGDTVWLTQSSIKLFVGTWLFNPNPVKGTESSNCYLDLTNNVNRGFSLVSNTKDKPVKLTELQAKYKFGIGIRSTAGSVIDMEWQPQMLLSDKLLPYSPYREQLLTLPTPNGLPGIPVTSGGNYTDPSGQQWVCDEVDLEREVRVQRVNKAAFDSTKTLAEQNAILATPIETPLTSAEIAAYKALTTYAPDTVVQASDSAGLKLGYQRDVSIVIKNLEDAIASMTTT